MSEHDLKYYLELPYTVVIRKDEEGDYLARIEELAGCTADGPTPEDALKALSEIQRAWLEEAIEAGQPIPEPQAEAGLPSGKWVQRVPRSLHRKLAKMAKSEGVSLNHLVSTILAESAGARMFAVTARASIWEETAKAVRWELIDAGSRASSRRPLLTRLGRATRIQEKPFDRAKRSHAKAEKFEYLQ
ncbi:MAG TPA: toxin-antitoxin system HicB family antitoxin [Candidatus Acidoferrales bacterium]|nr:toxin-antitoxin system HicB family antitoxin [Candidatus Acidoferrales bacterium]